jgi:hypothetical protein
MVPINNLWWPCRSGYDPPKVGPDEVRKMSATPDSTFADPQELIADLQRQLAEREAALAERTGARP